MKEFIFKYKFIDLAGKRCDAVKVIVEVNKIGTFTKRKGQRTAAARLIHKEAKFLALKAKIRDFIISHEQVKEQLPHARDWFTTRVQGQLQGFVLMKETVHHKMTMINTTPRQEEQVFIVPKLMKKTDCIFVRGGGTETPKMTDLIDFTTSHTTIVSQLPRLSEDAREILSNLRSKTCIIRTVNSRGSARTENIAEEEPTTFNLQEDVAKLETAETALETDVTTEGRVSPNGPSPRFDAPGFGNDIGGTNTNRSTQSLIRRGDEYKGGYEKTKNERDEARSEIERMKSEMERMRRNHEEQERNRGNTNSQSRGGNWNDEQERNRRSKQNQ